jgi:hypothetical protein
MAKVKITEQQAEHIEYLRSISYTNNEIIREWVENGRWEDEPEIFEKMCEALFTGYETKGKPEDELKKYYLKAQSEIFEIQDEWDGDEDEEDSRLAREEGKMEAIKFVIDIMDLKVRIIQ